MKRVRKFCQACKAQYYLCGHDEPDLANHGYDRLSKKANRSMHDVISIRAISADCFYLDSLAGVSGSRESNRAFVTSCHDRRDDAWRACGALKKLCASISHSHFACTENIPFGTEQEAKLTVVLRA